MWRVGRDAFCESYEFLLDKIRIAKIVKTYPHENYFLYYGFVLSDKYEQDFMGGETLENLIFKMTIRLKEYGWDIKGFPIEINS
jgi:hypothetical protein